jgi:hypothetical protein
MDVWIHGSSSLKPGRRSNPDDLKEMQPLSGFHSTRARQVPLHNIPMRRDFSRWKILWSWQFFGACQIQPQRGEKHGHDMQEACPHQIPLLGEVLRLGLGLGLRLGALRPPPRRRLRLARAAGVRSRSALLAPCTRHLPLLSGLLGLGFGPDLDLGACEGSGHVRREG